jgi:phosphoglycolate phosphatase-like HAD superfamily hydrolase
VKPEEVILIGDTESDVKAGRAAGCRVIGINIDADFSINSISELPNIINS